MQILFKIWIAKMIMIQIYSSELFLREKDKNCVNSDQYTEYFEDIWGSKVGSIEIPESYITCLQKKFVYTYRWTVHCKYLLSVCSQTATKKLYYDFKYSKWLYTAFGCTLCNQLTATVQFMTVNEARAQGLRKALVIATFGCNEK